MVVSKKMPGTDPTTTFQNIVKASVNPTEFAFLNTARTHMGSTDMQQMKAEIRPIRNFFTHKIPDTMSPGPASSAGK